MTTTLPPPTAALRPAPAPRTSVVEAAAAELLAAETAQAELADALHDGAVQALVSARWAIDGGDLTLAREAVQAALVELRHTLWHLRPRGDDLAEALEQLAERPDRLRPLTLQLDKAARTTPAVAAVAYRFVQHLSSVAGGPLTGTLVDGPEGVVLHLSDTPVPADLWTDRFADLGVLLTTLDTDLRLVLPHPVPTAKAPS